MRNWLLLLGMGLALAGCDSPRPEARIISAPPGDEKVSHSEPVFYNGKHYKVDFKYSRDLNAYAVKVTGKGRSLGSTEGDRKIVEQIALSTVRHFACPSRFKGQVVPGTSKHTGSAWEMQARCV